MSEHKAYFLMTVGRVQSGSPVGTLEELSTQVNKFLTEHPEYYPCGAPVYVPCKDGEGFWGWAQAVARK